MPFLDHKDRIRVEEAVAEGEKRTAAEFVCVVTRASGDYLHLPTLAAAVVMLTVSGLVMLAPWPVPVTFAEFHLGQVTMFTGLYLLFRWRPLRHRIVPRATQRRRAALRAHSVFLDLGLAGTRNRSGVLFFVSAAEHYVEIIADRGVRAVVEDREWAEILAAFAATVGDGRIADGFVAAVAACTGVLAERLPALPGDVDELPNRLVVL